METAPREGLSTGSIVLIVAAVLVVLLPVLAFGLFVLMCTGVFGTGLFLAAAAKPPVAEFQLDQPETKAPLEVLQVLDRNLIEVRLPEGKREELELEWIDPAEVDSVSSPEFNRAATAALAGLVANRNVTFKYSGAGKHRGGRPIGQVFVDGRNVNIELVLGGWAPNQVPTENTYGEDLSEYADAYAAAEAEAKAAQRGRWKLVNSETAVVPPADEPSAAPASP